ITLSGTVFGPGPPDTQGNRGLVTVPNQEVHASAGTSPAALLRGEGEDVGTVFTDDNGRYTFAVPIEVAQRAPCLLIEAIVDGVSCRLFYRLQVPGTLRSAAAPAAPNLVLDPVQEAAVRLLEAQGADNYSEAGIAAVVAAVEQANAASNFAGLSLAQANDLAE